MAHRLADAARAETLARFRTTGLDVASKASAVGGGTALEGAAVFDPVTEADRAAERRMRAILARDRPEDGILGEEYGAKAGTSGLTWVLDPVDGTRAFIAGAPTWGVLVAVADGEGPVIGVIDQPHIGERFTGTPAGARYAGPHGAAPLAVRAPRPMGDAILLSTFPEIGSEAERAAFARVAARVRLTRYGLDCYAYALLAMGQVDLVIEAGLQPYDIAAPIAVIEAAGGIVSDWQGGPAQHGGRVLAAANPEVHARALALLAR